MDGMGMELEYIKVYPASNPGWNGWMGWHALFYVPIYTPKCPLMYFSRPTIWTGRLLELEFQALFSSPVEFDPYVAS